MKHLVHSGWVAYTMGVSSGTHPIGDDEPMLVVNYLVQLINPDTHEVINHN